MTIGTCLESPAVVKAVGDGGDGDAAPVTGVGKPDKVFFGDNDSTEERGTPSVASPMFWVRLQIF